MNHDTMIANLRAIQKPCTSSRSLWICSQWVKKDKIKEAIRLAGDYGVTEGQCCALFSKVPLEQLRDSSHVILISSHADFVPAITKPFCKLKNTDESKKEKNSYLWGTFDNSITNAAVLNLMQEGNLPDNVVFALTGDEETGRCYGAAETVEILENLGIERGAIYPIALDVTYEGFGRKIEGHQVSFSIENITMHDSNVLRVADSLADAGEAYVYSCAPHERLPKRANPKYCGKSYSMFDEGTAYRRYTGNGFSFCIPCSGDMHSNAGVSVKTSVYFAYTKNLAGFIQNYHLELAEAENLAEHSQITR